MLSRRSRYYSPKLSPLVLLDDSLRSTDNSTNVVCRISIGLLSCRIYDPFIGTLVYVAFSRKGKKNLCCIFRIKCSYKPDTKALICSSYEFQEFHHNPDSHILDKLWLLRMLNFFAWNSTNQYSNQNLGSLNFQALQNFKLWSDFHCLISFLNYMLPRNLLFLCRFSRSLDPSATIAGAL